MGEITSSKLFRRITRLRWQAPLLALLLVLIHQILEHTWLLHLPRWWHFTTQVMFYGLVGPALAWLALTSLRRSAVETETAERALQNALSDLGEVNQRLSLLIEINRQLAEAGDEEILTERVLDLPLKIVPAIGCSLIRFDERQQPLPAVHRGQIKPEVLDVWTAHLADERIRQQCACCVEHTAVAGAASCPLLTTIPGELAIHKVHCLPLVRNQHTYGILNIYLADEHHPTEQEQSLLDVLAQEVSLALESQQLRSRELAMLSRLQQANRMSDLRQDLQDVLADTVAALDASGAVLFLADAETAGLQIQAEVEGERPLDAALSLIKSMADGAAQSDTPLIIRDLEQDGQTDIRSLLIALLRTDDQSLGSLALWAARPNAFTRRRTQLVSIVAGQAALLVENHRLYRQGEHQAALAERDRLAREIHDGLAQTLGYLKLRTALIAGGLQEGQVQQAAVELAEIQQLLNEATLDAREAVDGLRLKASEAGLHEWVSEIVAEFEALSGVPVIAALPPDVALSLEVQVQLQRIVQEILSNVRKHADATQVRLEWHLDERCLKLHVRDNGRGFDPDDVPPAARHGLRIMRERANLLAADFQITSRPDHGTQIMITLPLQKADGEKRDG